MQDNHRFWHAVTQNPIVIMGIRRRLRRNSLMFAGGISLAVSAFIYLIVFWTSTERGFTDTREAAKLAFLPLFIYQAFMLFFLGTGAVASGIADDKESGLLDYQRMTPMSPTHKILGYLFGLPIREYFMVAVTIPFVAFATVVGGIPVLKALQLYITFLVSVWLYHLAGMVAGMVAKRARRASMLARFTVVMLYVVLPALGNIGISFLGYFTVVPTFKALIQSEIDSPTAGYAVDTIFGNASGVPFFGVLVSPTLFSLMAQGLLLAAFFYVVHRKWRRDSFHGFSKRGAVLFFAGIQFLLCGSLWPLLSQQSTAAALLAEMGPTFTTGQLVFVLLAFYFAIAGAAALLLLYICTPSQHEFLRGLRRAQKKSLSSMPYSWDEASGLRLGLSLALISCISYGVLMLALRMGGLDLGAWNWTRVLLPIVYGALVLVAVQRLREWLSLQGFFAVLFVVWVIPSMAAAVALTAFSLDVLAAYIASPNPVVAVLFLLNGVSPELGMTRHLSPLTVASFASMLALAVVAHLRVKEWQSSHSST